MWSSRAGSVVTIAWEKITFLIGGGLYRVSAPDRNNHCKKMPSGSRHPFFKGENRFLYRPDQQTSYGMPD